MGAASACTSAATLSESCSAAIISSDFRYPAMSSPRMSSFDWVMAAFSVSMSLSLPATFSASFVSGLSFAGLATGVGG